MLELMRVKKCKKRNRTNFYWRVVKVCVGNMSYGGIGTSCFLKYWNVLSSNFLKSLNYIKSLCIVFMLTWFKYFDQKSDNFLFKNVSIFHKNMSQGAKCFNTPIFYATTWENLKQLIYWKVLCLKKVDIYKKCCLSFHSI